LAAKRTPPDENGLNTIVDVAGYERCVSKERQTDKRDGATTLGMEVVVLNLGADVSRGPKR